MKNYALLLAILLEPFCMHAVAQHYMLEGTVQNSRHEKLPGTTIVLQWNLGKNTFTKTGICDSAGYYRFEQLSAGLYAVSASHLGYLESIGDTVYITTATVAHTRNFILLEDSATLTGVVIQSKKQLIEMDRGKIVFNVQQMATATGLTAFDLLKKMPGVSIDQQENILLRGSPGVNVLIDGKMTYLSGKQLTTYLKGMSAEDLSKIELNIAPSAVFDAAGNAGIINIIPKKNKKKGYAIDLRSGITKGAFWMPAANIAFSRRAEKLNFFGSFDYKTPDSHWESSSGNTINTSGGSSDIRRSNSADYKSRYYTWHAGAEWQFLPKQQLAVDYLGYLDDYKSSNNTTVENYNAQGELLSFIRSANAIKEPYHYDGANLSYRFDIDTTGKKITADAHYTAYRNFSDGKMTTREFDAAGTFTGAYDLLAHQPGFIRIKSVQTDAELPFAKFSFKAGAKYAAVTNDNAYQFDSLINGRTIPSEIMTNHFIYRERIAAVYFSTSKKIRKILLDAGLRMEYTDANGQTLKENADNRRTYIQLFPAFSLEREISSRDKINFSVSRRINRPSYSDLNPVRWYTDQYYYYAGNPDLVPEMTWILSGAYSLKHKYIFTLSYNNSNNYINRKLFRDDNGIAISSRSANLGTMQQLSLIASIPLQPFSFWTLQLTPDLNYMTYPVSQLDGSRSLSKWYGTLTAQQQFKLPANTKVELFTQYATPAIRGIYSIKSYYYTDIGFSKSFFAGKLDVQFTLSDVFNTSRYRGISQSNIANYWYQDKPDTRKIGVFLHYHLGSELVKGNKKKTEEQERL